MEFDENEETKQRRRKCYIVVLSCLLACFIACIHLLFAVKSSKQSEWMDQEVLVFFRWVTEPVFCFLFSFSFKIFVVVDWKKEEKKKAKQQEENSNDQHGN